MHEQVKHDILSVLEHLIGILRVKEDKDIIELKDLSNHVIHNASVFQDDHSVSVAVIIYALSKIIERKQDLDYARLSRMADAAIASLKKDDDAAFHKNIESIFGFVRAMDQKLSLYINEVIQQAQVKKGCKLCEHGISVARSSEVLGVSQWEMMHYLGKTTLVDQFSKPINLQSRLKFARSLFR